MPHSEKWENSFKRDSFALSPSKCTPILLYSLEVCPLTKTDNRSLDFVVMRFLMKLFCISDSDTVSECRTRTGKFLSKLFNVVNSC